MTDGSFIYLMSRFGIGPEPALAAMLLLRVSNLPPSLAGANFYLAAEQQSVPRVPPGVGISSEPMPRRANL